MLNISVSLIDDVSNVCQLVLLTLRPLQYVLLFTITSLPPFPWGPGLEAVHSSQSFWPHLPVVSGTNEGSHANIHQIFKRDVEMRDCFLCCVLAITNLLKTADLPLFFIKDCSIQFYQLHQDKDRDTDLEVTICSHKNVVSFNRRMKSFLIPFHCHCDYSFLSSLTEWCIISINIGDVLFSLRLCKIF